MHESRPEDDRPARLSRGRSISAANRPEPINVESLLELLVHGNRQERREAHRVLTKLERQAKKKVRA